MSFPEYGGWSDDVTLTLRRKLPRRKVICNTCGSTTWAKHEPPLRTRCGKCASARVRVQFGPGCERR
jgi:ribosomal protein S27AE